jgi:uncharacterized protein (TIGR02145 family)
VIERQKSGGVRALRLTAAAIAIAAVAAVWLSGCSGDSIGEVLAAAGHGSGGKGGGGSSETVTLGGKKWMTKNLNVPASDSWCYGNSSSNCDKYGRLYTWSAAKAACQSVGMRLPTRAEWDALVTAAGGSSTAGSKLKSKSGWYSGGNGTDQYGFSALPGGYRNSGGSFNDAGNYGNWWTATENDGSLAYSRHMNYNNDHVNENLNYKSYGFSVRCLED